MDQAPLQEEVDIHEGIENTLTILKNKLKYGVEVKREYGDLPHICAYGSQLNQVWTNLIDNAIDGMELIMRLMGWRGRDISGFVNLRKAFAF